MYDALYKKKGYLDSFSEGLEMYRLFSLIKLFPLIFETAFVSKNITSVDVLNNLIPPGIEDSEEKKLLLLLTHHEFIVSLSVESQSVI